MKQKIRTALIIAAIIAIAAFTGLVFFRPIPIVPPGSAATVLFLRYNWEDVTYTTDLDKVVEILKNYYTRRTFHNPFPTFVANETWGMTIMRQGGHVTITLGVDNVLYRSGSDRIWHRIINPDELMYELSLLLTP